LLLAFEFRSPLGELQIELTNFLLSVPALFDLTLKAVAGLPKIALNCALSGGEPGNNDRPNYENEKER
jgi:hypothetical protein